MCRRCERWNLSPLEERWEAFEECERLFRATRLRMSTDNIGLARLKEGLELVRIGAPLRPEFAAWRYGDQFGRRRKRAILYTVGGIAAFGALMTGAAVAGIGTGGLWGLWNAIANLPVRARLRAPDGRLMKVRQSHLASVRLLRDPDSDGLITTIRHRGLVRFTGEDATRAAGILLPALNLMAGTRAAVREAVDTIEAAGHPEAYLDQVRAGLPWYEPQRGRKRRGATAGRLPRTTRLALEMALHEEQERRALAEELLTLEAAWREAEEIAGIADNLLTPAAHQAFIENQRTDHTPAETE